MARSLVPNHTESKSKSYRKWFKQNISEPEMSSQEILHLCTRLVAQLIEKTGCISLIIYRFFSALSNCFSSAENRNKTFIFFGVVVETYREKWDFCKSSFWAFWCAPLFLVRIISIFLRLLAYSVLYSTLLYVILFDFSDRN